ncbi:MAG: cobalamin-dependent protein [Kiritimatiellae bacterium]|nr:cobalamin-dependent protein [Kiritimatiellia bacterium]MDD4736970.1 cobalamin-dependent protein [Kiritimatiellia bacterium]
MSAEYLDKLQAAILEGEEDDAAQAARDALEAGIAPIQLINDGIQKPLEKIGKDFENGECFLPELILSGDAARAATDIIMPKLTAGERADGLHGTAVIGVVSGDLHDIGKNIVGAFLAAQGLKVIDLGCDVSPKRFVDTVAEQQARFIVISTLLTTSRPFYRQIVDTLKARGLRDKTYVLVGGGPVTPAWAREVGADAYGRDAKDAVACCRELLTSGVQSPLAEPLIVNALQSKA